MKSTLTVFPTVALLSLIFSLPTSALECPPFPQQVSKDIEAEVKALVGQIGPVKGGELDARTQSATKDLISRLPNADRIFLEQMMYAAYCTGLRDDRKLSDSEKTQQLIKYNEKLRLALSGQSQQTSQPFPGPSSGDKRLFFDDFSTDSHRWSVLGSEARVTSGIFAVIGRPLIVALVDDQDLRNCSVRSKVKLISENYDFGILIAANAPNEKCGDFYYVQFSKSGGLTYDNSSISIIRSECKNRSWDKLDSKTFPIKRNQWLNVRIDFQSTTISAYVNDSRVISVEDAFYDRGKVGLRANETQIFVDDFEVISLANP
jgi:hypothetical protein